MAVADGARCCGSIDNWLFLMQNDGGCSLTNPFSKATLDLPKLATVWRPGGSLALDSSPESLVVLILDCANSSTVCICQPPVATDMSRGRHMEPSRCLSDVAFFNGKLYGVAFGDKLVIFEIGYIGSKPKISVTECIINSRDDLWDLPQSLSREKGYMLREYLVESCGRLLKADLSTNPGHWRRVDKLGGQALFVGRHCSKLFAAEEFCCDPLRDSGVYNLRNGTITPLLSQTATVPQHHGGHWRPTWFFPADSI
uniref:KIB1-4 beta-propeller domain-containing protein n=1 Tax=Setaria italica TaxID=4555 RepID=K3XYY0_SETIT